MSFLTDFTFICAIICFVVARVSVAAPSTISSSPFKRIFNEIVQKLPEEIEKELQEPPHLKFTSIPEDIAASEGSKVTFLCEADGISPPVLRWTFNDRPIKQGRYEKDDNTLEKLTNVGKKTIERGITVSKLTIDCATLDSAGVYKCIADNGHQIIQSSARLIVEEGNSVEGCDRRKKSQDGRVPVIYMWTDGRVEVEGANAQIFCRAKGHPEPEIQWLTSEGRPATLSPSLIQLPNGDLLIEEADFSSLDAYTCVAKNVHGEDRVEAFFYPTEPETQESQESVGTDVQGEETDDIVPEILL